MRQILGYLSTASGINSLSPLSLATDVTDATLGASGLCLGTQGGAGGTATLAKSFFGRSPWIHGQQEQDYGIWASLSSLIWLHTNQIQNESRLGTN